ncbi:MAG: amino acid permease [Propionibacteriaceae bacterium]|nr:amino acid permease [Propionibacteriaceae bacterium]
MSSELSSAANDAVNEELKEIAGMQRRLKNRHIQMIALGGCIGTGLFYGSAEAIGMAGPAIILAYLVGGAAIFFVMRAVGEMSVRTPVAGAFTHHAYANWGNRAGFVSGWNYWFNYILVSMVELAVVGLYLHYWLPDFPAWATAAICLVLITAVNLIGVKSFGEFEFWFAMIKVIAVIAMIVVGLIIVIAAIHNPGTPVPTFSHLVDPSTGGFLPFGLLSQVNGAWVGLVMALVVVMFSFGGVELVAITAGEADNPGKTIPRAINQIAWRILIFFVGALTVIMAVVPWQSINGQMSPFVQIFDYVGIKAAAALLNFVCITAVLSVYNSAVYSNGRMLHSLAHQGNAPKFLGKVAKNGVPMAGVLASAGITVIAVVVVFLWPEFAFNYLMSIALIAGIINWIMVMITEIKFRKRIGPEEVSKLTFKLPFQPYSNYLVIAFLAFVVVMMCFSPGYRIAVIVGPIWLAVLLIAYQVKKTGQKVADRT